MMILLKIVLWALSGLIPVILFYLGVLRCYGEEYKIDAGETSFACCILFLSVFLGGLFGCAAIILFVFCVVPHLQIVQNSFIKINNTLYTISQIGKTKKNNDSKTE